jgi:hypothetical protein
MLEFYSKRLFSLICSGLVLLLLAGCASVSSTSIYYLPYTTDTYPPKAPDAEIPILGKAPDRPYKTIGRLAFSTANGWRFLRESMLYNARVNGADAVILKDTSSRKELGIVQVPPRFNWIPVPGPAYRTKKGDVYYGTTYIPDYQPGYAYPTTWTMTGIDAEMIVFKK